MFQIFDDCNGRGDLGGWLCLPGMGTNVPRGRSWDLLSIASHILGSGRFLVNWPAAPRSGLCILLDVGSFYSNGVFRVKTCSSKSSLASGSGLTV